jgi:hypothetical protein
MVKNNFGLIIYQPSKLWHKLKGCSAIHYLLRHIHILSCVTANVSAAMQPLDQAEKTRICSSKACKSATFYHGE